MPASGHRPGDSEPRPAGQATYTFEDRVLHAFIRGGRLVSIPAQDRKKLVILRYLAERCFEPDAVYSELEVNERLRTYHEDVAALRRYLVEMGFMSRSGGEYRRLPGR